MMAGSNKVEPELSTRKRRHSRKDQKALKKQRRSGQPASTNSDSSRSKNDETPANIFVEDQATFKDSNKSASIDPEVIDYLSDYTTILVPKAAAKSTTAAGVSLGKWFPKAKTMKSKLCFSNDKKTVARASLLLFYQYAQWNDEKVSILMEYLQVVGNTRVLGGRIRIAAEGVNATVSSVDSPDMTSARTLRHFVQDLKGFDSAFADTDFKLIDNLSPDRHFKDLKLIPVKELVFYGIREAEAPLQMGGTHLSAEEFHDKLAQENTVVVDVRNHYEADIGRFDGQQVGTTGGATYIDPKMRKSTDFTTWLAKPETKEQLKEKQVLLFCTGGVRCERASAYLKKQMGNSVKGCYQLKGGIERYLQTFDDGGFWRGKNFVFDKREAIGAHNINGDGGIIKHASVNDNNVGAKCCICASPWDRYIGKKKCHMCGVPVLMCDSCMTTRSKEVTRCPLCVEEDITVPAVDVEYTNNGVGVRGEKGDKKQAPSVLKWGGGHASEKKEKRKMKRIACQFGADCIRKDCFFSHPEQEQSLKKILK